MGAGSTFDQGTVGLLVRRGGPGRMSAGSTRSGRS
jgi:hypothetical protein